MKAIRNIEKIIGNIEAQIVTLGNAATECEAEEIRLQERAAFVGRMAAQARQACVGLGKVLRGS